MEPESRSIRNGYGDRVLVHVMLVLLVTIVFVAGAAAHRAVHIRLASSDYSISLDSGTQRNLALFHLVDTNAHWGLVYFLLCIAAIALSLQRQYPKWAVYTVTFSLLVPGLVYGIFCAGLCAKFASI